MSSTDRAALPWWRTARLALWLILAGGVAFGVTAGAGYRSLQQLAQHDQERRTDEQTLALIDKTLALLLDIESGQRGYLLSGSTESLEPYQRGKAKFPDTYADLVQHLSGSSAPGDQFRAARQRIDELVRRRIALAEAQVLKRQSGAAEAPGATTTATTTTGTDLDGKLAMDAIRVEFEMLGGAQREHIAARDADAARLQARTAALIIALTAGGCAMMIGAVWLLSDERRRLAREVHDQFGQIVTGSKLVVQQMARDHPELPPGQVAQLVGMLDESIAVARRIATALRPPLLDDLGFAAAVSHFAERLNRPEHLEITAEIDHDDWLESDRANQLFRIVQEATTNALRHAQATRVSITGCEFRGLYVLRIADNGIGPQPVRADASGLRNMRERAAMVGGAFEFGPGPDGGCEVVARIPLHQPAPDARRPGTLP